MISAPPIDEDKRARGRARKQRRQRRRIAVWTITAVAALGGALAGAEPTGVVLFDLTFAAVAAAAVTYAASRARRWSWIVISAGAAIAAPSTTYTVIAGVGLAVVLVEVYLDRRDRWAGAIVGAMSVQVLLRLGGIELFGLTDDVGFVGATTLLGLALCAPVLISGYRNGRRHERRAVLYTLGAVAVLIVIAAAAFGLTARQGRSTMVTAVDQARQGLEALRLGDTDEAALLLSQSASSFDTAYDQLASPLALPARAVPILGYSAEATTTIAEAGADVARAASIVADTADYRSLRVGDGQIDLAAVAAMQQPADEATAALDRASATLADLDSPWLLPQLRGPLDDFAAEINESIPDARLAAEGLRVAPDLLGADGIRRYFVIFATPAESRGLGGFMGNFGILTADNGRVDLVRHGRPVELEKAPGADQRTLSGPDDYLARYARYSPTLLFKNLTASPDFPTVADTLRELYPQAAGEDIDGVIYVDPYGLAGLLELTGPVDVEGLDRPLTADNAAQFLLRDQYVEFPDSDERTDLLGASTEATFEALVSRELPGPTAMGDLFGPLTRQGRFLMTSFDEEEESFLEALGLLERFGRPDDDDFVSVRTANAGANKIDAYVERRVDYQADYDPATGALDGTVTVSLTNTAPPGLPDYVAGNVRLREEDAAAPVEGTAVTWVELYTPHAVDELLVDGVSVPFTIAPELGWWVYSIKVDVAPNSTVTVTYPFTGEIVPTDDYRLRIDHQALVNDDEMTVVIDPAEGWQSGEQPASEPFAVTENTEVTVAFEPD